MPELDFRSLNLETLEEDTRVYESHESGISWDENTADIIKGREVAAGKMEAVRSAVNLIRKQGATCNHHQRRRIKRAIDDFVDAAYDDGGGRGPFYEYGNTAPYRAVEKVIENVIAGMYRTATDELADR